MGAVTQTSAGNVAFTTRRVQMQQWIAASRFHCRQLPSTGVGGSFISRLVTMVMRCPGSSLSVSWIFMLRWRMVCVVCVVCDSDCAAADVNVSDVPPLMLIVVPAGCA